MQKLLVIIFSILFFFILILLFVINLTTYEKFVLETARFISLKYGNYQQFKEILSPAVFYRIKICLFILAFLNLIILFLILFKKNIIKITANLIKPILLFPTWIFKSFNKLNKNEKIFLVSVLLIIAIQRFFLSINTSVIYDEAWTYLAFTSKNPLIAAFFYPASNNHILYSHLTQITKFLPLNILINLRLPAFFIGLFSSLVFYFCAKQYLKKFGLWIAFLMFSFAFPSVYYGFAARGYSLILLMFIIGFFAALKIVEGKKKYWYCFSLSSAIGFYTIPVYLYPFVTIILFLFLSFLANKNRSEIFHLIKHISLACLLVLILYLPVFAVSGVQSVTNNKFVQSQDFNIVFNNFSGHIFKTLKFFTAVEYGFLLVFLIIILVIYVLIKGKFNNKSILFFSLLCFLLIPVLVFTHRVVPVERTWIYLLVPLCFMAGKIAELKFVKYLLALVIIFNLFNISINWQKQMLWYDNICEEDYEQGIYFTNYFKNKKVLIVAKNRMNTYLKFNNKLYKQNWEIHSKMPDKSDRIVYAVYHTSEKNIDKNLIKKGYFKNYYLYCER
ncbi:MAG: hypothetical protein HUU47_07565 [Bacteroidetes bacterium]|nr:hypothetical protein [Bacteroidota bacterium]